MIVIKLLVRQTILTVDSVYALQQGLADGVKDKFLWRAFGLFKEILF